MAIKSKTTNARSTRQGRRSREEARHEILTAAVEFLWEHPFRDLTIPKLMDRTSIGRSAFYVYFRDRYQLVEALLQLVQDSTEQAAIPWMTGGDEPLKELRETVKAMIDTYVIHGPVIRAVSEAAPLDPKLDILWNTFLKAFDQSVEAAVFRDQKAGLIASINVAETAYAINRMDIAYLNGRLGRRPQADLETVANTLYDIISRTFYKQTENPSDTGCYSKKHHLSEVAN